MWHAHFLLLGIFLTICFGTELHQTGWQMGWKEKEIEKVQQRERERGREGGIGENWECNAMQLSEQTKLGGVLRQHPNE